MIPRQSLLDSITPPLLENLSPFREEPGRVSVAVSMRNAFFDSIFYDTTNLSRKEKTGLLGSGFNFEEGGMLYVHPFAAGREIEYISLSHDLMDRYPDLDTVTIPGVGSSLIGSASFARQIANITGRPAVGIIAGYGAADMISEALGGWFYFGMRNRISAVLADWKRRFAPERRSADQIQRVAQKMKVKSMTFMVEEPESNTLLNIMLRQAAKLRLVVGHSKGALNIQNVLRAFVKETDLGPNDYQHLAIVTFGCGVAIPGVFKNVHQHLGSRDLLGILNTPRAERRDPSVNIVMAKGHNLCSWNPMHMPVDELLRDALAASVD